MARLKTDWILFLTILAMVALRPGDGLQRVERRGGAAVSRRAVLFRRCASWAGPWSRFFVLMYFKRMDYRRLNTPAWAFSGLGIVLGLLVMVYFVDPHAHRWFRVRGRRLVSAFRIRQTGADLVSGVLHRRGARTSSTIAGRCSRRSSRWLMLAVHGGGGGPGHGAGARDHGRDRVLGGGSGVEVYAAGRG